MDIHLHLNYFFYQYQSLLAELEKNSILSEVNFLVFPVCKNLYQKIKPISEKCTEKNGVIISEVTK